MNRVLVILLAFTMALLLAGTASALSPQPEPPDRKIKVKDQSSKFVPPPKRRLIKAVKPKPPPTQKLQEKSINPQPEPPGKR